MAINNTTLPAVIETMIDEEESDCICLRWFIPTIPYMIAWWFVMYAWVAVTVMGKLVGLVEMVTPHVVDSIKALVAWCKKSAVFRMELINEWQESEGI